MADNPIVDNGDLVDIRVTADEIASPYGGDISQAQGVKLIDGTNTSNEPIPGTTANGLDVDVTRVAGVGAGLLLKAEDDAHATGDAGVQLLAVRKDAAAALAGTDGDYIPLIVDSSGRLHIAPLPAGAEAIGSVIVTDVTPGTQASDLGKAEDAAHATGDTGVAVWAVRKDTAAALAGTDGDYAPLEVDAAGRLHVNVGSIPAAAHGTDSIAAVLAPLTAPPTGFTALSALKVISAASTNATSVKGSAGQLYWLHVVNTNAAARFLKLYNKATAPTVGTDVPIHTFAIPGNTGGAGFVIALPVPITFATGIALALTTGVADADAGAVAANEIVVNGGYR